MQVASPPKEKRFYLVPLDIAALTTPPGKSTLDDQLGFFAYGLEIDNPTAQWWFVTNLDMHIPPYTVGVQLPIQQGTQVAQVRPVAPGGVDQYPSVEGQLATFTYKQVSVNAPFAGVQARIQPNEMVVAVNFCPD